MPKTLIDTNNLSDVASPATSRANLGVGTVVVNQTAATYNATATTGYLIVLCDTTTNAIAVNLPTAVGNLAMITVKKTNSSANNVTVDGLTTETIDGGLTAVLAVQYESITLVSDNANWQII